MCESIQPREFVFAQSLRKSFHQNMWNRKPCFRFEIDNFSDKEPLLASQVFVSGGCEWYLNLRPKGNKVLKLDNDFLSLCLNVANPKSLRRGWKRIVKFYFVVVNQFDKELYRSPIGGEARTVYCAEIPSCLLATFNNKGSSEKDRVIIELYINIVQAFDGEGGDVSSEKEKIVDINGFQVFASQVTPVTKIFAEHPDLAEDLKVKNQVVKTVYMNMLNLNETLNKASQNRSEIELSNAHSELSELAEVGFKLDWLKLKLDESSLNRKIVVADGSCVKERVKNFEESNFKLEPLKPKVKEVSLEKKKADDDHESRVQQLEERLKNIELMELDFKLDCLNSKLEEVSLERKKSDDVDGSRVQQLEERLKSIELMELDFKLDCLNSNLEKVSMEKKKKADDDRSRVQQLEECVRNLLIMVSDLKIELNKKKDKSSDDGFLLVD